jgi:cytochrome P450
VETRRGAYLPFSLGPRSCVGRPLALLELRVVVIKLLQEFDFSVVHDDPAFQETPKVTMTLEPASLKIIVKPLR